MKKLTIFGLMTSAIMLLSCQKSIETPLYQSQQPITFELVSDNPTRATETKFEVGDVIGVTITRKDGSVYAKNIKAIYDGVKWAPENNIYWDDMNNLTFNVLYPYIDNGGQSNFEFNIELDQSTPKGYSKSQLLVANVLNVEKSANPIKLRYRNVLSSLEIRFIRSSEVSTEDMDAFIKTVMVTNLSYSGLFLFKNTLNANSKLKGDITLNKIDALVYRAYILPQAVNESKPVIVKITTTTGVVTEFTLNSDYFFGGERKVIEFNVGRNQDQSISITQNKRITDYNINLDPEGNVYQLMVRDSNLYDIEVPASDKSWLSARAAVAKGSYSIVDVTATPLEGDATRTGEIHITQNGVVIEVVKVTQAKTIFIEITKPDILAEVLSQMDVYKYASFTVKGPLSNKDFWEFKSLPNLTYLDISDVETTDFNEYAFSGMHMLRSIILPKGLKKTGPFLFENCRELVEVLMPEGLTEISKYAFEGCSSLRRIAIPSTVTLIDEFAFRYCVSLEKFDLDANVTKLGSKAFFGCTSLSTVSIDEGISYIPYELFTGCTSLSKINIPLTVKTIGSGAFKDCTSLTEISLPADLTKISYQAFMGAGLLNINIPGNVSEIEWSAFEGCKELATAEIPNSITSIGVNAFGKCGKLETIVCHLEVPFGDPGFVFSNGSANKIVKVPAGSLAAYKANIQWSREFNNGANIFPI